MSVYLIWVKLFIYVHLVCLSLYFALLCKICWLVKCFRCCSIFFLNTLKILLIWWSFITGKYISLCCVTFGPVPLASVQLLLHWISWKVKGSMLVHGYLFQVKNERYFTIHHLGDMAGKGEGGGCVPLNGSLKIWLVGAMLRK